MDNIKPVVINTEDEYGNKYELTDRVFKIKYVYNGEKKHIYVYESFLLLLDLNDIEREIVKKYNENDIKGYIKVFKRRLENGYIIF